MDSTASQGGTEPEDRAAAEDGAQPQDAREPEEGIISQGPATFKEPVGAWQDQTEVQNRMGAPADASEPPRPVLVYDGDCGFCISWIDAWRADTGDLIEFTSYQESAARFPHISPEGFAHSVRLVMPDGEVLAGAHAVFKALSVVPGKAWMLWCYRHVPFAREISELSYRLVAEHRSLISRLMAALWRKPAESYVLTRWTFLRLLGLIYLVAFVSLWLQVDGLIGWQGIIPAERLLHAVHSRIGAMGYWLVPSLAWFNSSDDFLKLLCAAGSLAGLLVVGGIATVPALASAWILYLSLVAIGSEFMSFQWDSLLLETGFLAIFFAPGALIAGGFKSLYRQTPPSAVVLFLLRWLLFRLMFSSGAVKLLSGDPAWRDLTAMSYHYYTQPLPTPPAWLAEQLPLWFHKLSTAGVFLLELGVPLLIFAPRRLRLAGAVLLIGFQIVIAFTGNYTFFNLLTIALCLLLIDDSALQRLIPKRIVSTLAEARAGISAPRPHRIWLVPFAVVMIVITATEFIETVGARNLLPFQLRALSDLVSPFNIANNYGLFAVMTTSRPEIIVEGSNDLKTWLPYEFKFKPGELRRAPPWVAPYQPRLDWQMWFAALGDYRSNPWFVNFVRRLLEGSPSVVALLEKNPFPGAPPKSVRALVYDYEFTTFDEMRATGAWWRRKLRGLYIPPLTLDGEGTAGRKRQRSAL